MPAENKPDPQAEAAVHHAEAMKLISAGHFGEAARHFSTAAQLEPANPVRHFNCGLVFQQMNRPREAVEHYRKAVGLAPDFFDAWNNQCAAFKEAGDAESAVAAGQTALSLRPQAASAHLNLGNALKARGDLTGAEAAYRRAVGLEPANPRFRVNLANTLRESGRVGEAIAILRDVVKAHPNFAEAHRDLAFALLISGDLSAGWSENEWRWQTDEMRPKRRMFDSPLWRGEDLSGRRLLVCTEQGFGDAVQFARFLSVVADRSGSVILECQPSLRRLFTGLTGANELISRGDPIPLHDFHTPLLSLPDALGTTLDSIPNRVPYLSVPPAVVVNLPAVGRGQFNVGLVWAGNPAHQNDRGRSLPLDLLAPVIAVDGVAFFSLQVGESSADLSRSALGSQVSDLAPQLTDFAVTAAAIARLDLVIAVDTAVAHLAGALAKRVWVLLPFAPDWRWLLGRDDSPWYPTARLFRQPRPGDWSAVIQNVARQLKALV